MAATEVPDAPSTGRPRRTVRGPLAALLILAPAAVLAMAVVVVGSTSLDPGDVNGVRAPGARTANGSMSSGDAVLVVEGADGITVERLVTIRNDRWWTVRLTDVDHLRSSGAFDDGCGLRSTAAEVAVVRSSAPAPTRHEARPFDDDVPLHRGDTAYLWVDGIFSTRGCAEEMGESSWRGVGVQHRSWLDPTGSSTLVPHDVVTFVPDLDAWHGEMAESTATP